MALTVVGGLCGSVPAVGEYRPHQPKYHQNHQLVRVCA